LRSDNAKSRGDISPGQQANILDAAYPERNRSAWKEPRNTNIRRGIDSLAPARFGLTARPSMSLGSRRLHSRCGATFSQI